MTKRAAVSMINVKKKSQNTYTRPRDTIHRTPNRGPAAMMESMMNITRIKAMINASGWQQAFVA
jgi:hypothetical protein